MEETTRSKPTALLVVLAVLVAVAAVWATTALARGGSGSGPVDPAGGTTDPWPMFVQSGDDGAAPSREDCPEQNGGSGGDGSGTDGSSNPSL